MKTRLPLPLLALVVTLASAPLAAQDAQQRPASNTSGSERTVQIIWEPGAPPPDVNSLLRRLLTTEAEQVGQGVLNVQPDVARKAVHPASTIKVADHSCTVHFSVVLDLPQTHARPAAREFADELVERLANLLRDDRTQAALRRLDEAKEETAKLEQELEALRKQRRGIQAQLGNGSGRADASPEAVQAAVTKLEDERQRLELELAGMEARLEAVQDQIEKATVRGQKEAAADPVVPELENAVAARQKLVDLTRKRVDAGAATPQDLSAVEAELSEARVQLLDRRAAGSARGGEAVAPLTRELQNLGIDIRDRKARLAYVDKRLRPLRDVSPLLDELQGIQGRYQSATRAWEEAQTRLRDARSRAEMGAVDRVIVTDAGDAQAPAERVQ